MNETMQSLLGKTGTYACGGLAFEVRVTDVKSVYGNTRVYIIPANGTGGKWVNLESVVLSEPVKP